MFERLKDFFGFRHEPDYDLLVQDEQIAVAALFIHLMEANGVCSDAERAYLKQTLSAQFHLDEDEVDYLIKQARYIDRQAIDLEDFIHTIIRKCSTEQRVRIINKLEALAGSDDDYSEIEQSIIERVKAMFNAR